MKEIIFVSLFMLAAVFALPFIFISEEPLLPVSREAADEPDIGETAAVEETAETLPEPSDEPLPEPLDEREPFDGNTYINIAGREERMSLRDYLRGVMLGEMPSSFPLEAVKAQAVAARTYVMRDPGAVYCGDPSHCMAYVEPGEDYPGIFDEALDLTDGEIIVYEGEPILAVFFCTSWGATENAEDVWGGEYPYLKAVESRDGEDANRYRGSVTVSAGEFWRVLKAEYPGTVESPEPFGGYNRTASGGVTEVEIGGVSVPGRDVRRMFGLNSANFTGGVIDGDIVFETLGFGHGVGMPQYGALAMAREGAGYREILEWYYTSVQITDNG